MKKEKGYTLVEVTLAIVLMAIVLPPLLQWFAQMTVTAAELDRLPIATSLASGLMEEVKSRKFDELDAKSPDGNWSAPLGPDAGEATKSSFDDVDDFEGWAQTFTGEFSGYAATVTVDYVAVNDLNTTLAIPAPVPDDWTPSYKRVVVSVSHPSLQGAVQMITVVTEVQSL